MNYQDEINLESDPDAESIRDKQQTQDTSQIMQKYNAFSPLKAMMDKRKDLCLNRSVERWDGMVTKHQNKEVHKFASTHCILFANLKKLLAKKKFKMKLKVSKYQKSEKEYRDKCRMYLKLL